MGLRHTPLAVSKLEEGRVEAGRPGRRPEQRCQGENRAGPGGRKVCEAESSIGLRNIVPGEGVQENPESQAWVAGWMLGRH